MRTAEVVRGSKAKAKRHTKLERLGRSKSKSQSRMDRQALQSTDSYTEMRGSVENSHSIWIFRSSLARLRFLLAPRVRIQAPLQDLYALRYYNSLFRLRFCNHRCIADSLRERSATDM